MRAVADIRDIEDVQALLDSLATPGKLAAGKAPSGREQSATVIALAKQLSAWPLDAAPEAALELLVNHRAAASVLERGSAEEASALADAFTGLVERFGNPSLGEKRREDGLVVLARTSWPLQPVLNDDALPKLVEVYVDLPRATIQRQANEINDLDGLRSALNQPPSYGEVAGRKLLTPEIESAFLINALAPRISSFPKEQQVDAYYEVMAAFHMLPPHLQTDELKNTLDTVDGQLLRPRMEGLARGIQSFEDLGDVIGKLNPHDPQRADPGTQRRLDKKLSYFLASVVEQIKHFPAGERPAAHELVSNAITMLPRDLRDEPAEKLAAAEVSELIGTDIIQAYERSGRLERTAGEVENLAGLRALLAQAGIEGPGVPDDAIGASVQADGNLGWDHLRRPEPLAALADRIGHFEPKVPGEANAAFQAVLAATNGISPERRRIPALMALASAAGRLDDHERQAAYANVLTAGQSLWLQGRITSGQYTGLLGTIASTISTGQSALDQAAAQQLRRAIDQMDRPGYQSILKSIVGTSSIAH